MVEIFLGLGSNLSNPLFQVTYAMQKIAQTLAFQKVKKSPLYRSKPMGPSGQDDYINAVIAFDAEISGSELLMQMQLIERSFGRIKTQRWGARIIDIDILLLGDQQIHSENLIIPHPGMTTRCFVLLPLIDLAGEHFYIPGKGQIKQFSQHCKDDLFCTQRVKIH